jgi:hypothetical protein
MNIILYLYIHPLTIIYFQIITPNAYNVITLKINFGMYERLFYSLMNNFLTL